MLPQRTLRCLAEPHEVDDGGEWGRAGSGYRRRMISLPHLCVGTTLAASTLLGAGVRSGRIDLGERRWLHHALYAGSLAAATGAAVADAARGRPTWPIAASTLGVLVLLPATRGGSGAHMAVAIAASTVYAAGTISTLRSASLANSVS